MFHRQVSTTTPVSYYDRLRIRFPGDSVFALGPHIDGGSLERWEDPGSFSQSPSLFSKYGTPLFDACVAYHRNLFPILYRLSFLLCSSPKRRIKTSKPTRFLGSLASTEREQRFVQWRRTVFCLSNVPVSRRRCVTSIGL